MLSFPSSNIASKTRTISRRMFLVNCFKAVVLFGIVGRLTALQVTESRKYKSLSDKNRFREKKIFILKKRIAKKKNLGRNNNIRKFDLVRIF